MSVVIETTLGDITVDLYLNQRPRTCLNFLKQCKVKYYNLCVFHKVERNFIAQTGDPTQTGRGGESVFCQLYGEQAKYFEAEMKPRLKHEKLGTLSMVNNGENMNGSQFFITLGENLTYLDEEHTVFGEVTEGFEVLLRINESICDSNDRPYQDIRITHTVVLHDPYEDPSGLDIPPSSPIPTKEQLQSNYIGADEEIDDTKGKNMEEIEEKIKDSEAKARATILEMVGDIPDADVKPPENVLFVCKLNPVTTSEDLEVIFSRFGSIVSCEVIKDRKTDESLQYAFIEFENEADCESAYFKMDNVLIDDRRIHVDFSQSVSKMKSDNDKFGNTQTRNMQNLVLKEKVKTQDKYDMIFDINDDSNIKESANFRTKPTCDKSESSKRKYKNDSILSHHSNHEDKRSRDGRKRSSSREHYSRRETVTSDSRKHRSYEHIQDHYSKTESGDSRKRTSHSSRAYKPNLRDFDKRRNHDNRSYSSSQALEHCSKLSRTDRKIIKKDKDVSRSSSESSSGSSSTSSGHSSRRKKIDYSKKKVDRLSVSKQKDNQISKQKEKRYSSSSSDSSSSSSESSQSDEKRSKKRTKHGDSISKSTQGRHSDKLKIKERHVQSHHSRHEYRDESKSYDSHALSRRSNESGNQGHQRNRSSDKHYHKKRTHLRSSS